MTARVQDSSRPPETLTLASSNGSARPSRISSRNNHATWRLVGLALLGHMLRSRRFYERVAFAAVMLAALSKLGQENRTKTFARLTAWNRRQIQFLERKAAQEAVRLERGAKRQAKRLAG
jgi:hypothetical protein